MNEATIRLCRKTDHPAVAELWCDIFDDLPAVPEFFLENLPRLGAGFVADCEGEIAGCAFAVTDLTLCGDEEKKIGYVYAVAVKERFRHHGLGARLTRAAADYIQNRGALLTIQPAEDSLFSWYETVIGTTCALYRQRRELPAGGEITPERLDAAEYARRRLALVPRPFIQPGQAAMEYEELLLRTYGGGLFAFPGGITAVGEGAVREILGGGERECAALAEALGMEKITAFFPGTEGERYIAAEAGALDAKTFWNLSLD